MQEKILIGRFEATCVIIALICTQIFINFPRMMMESAGTAGWILTLYVSIVAFFLFMIISRLYTPFEGKDLLDLGEYIGGKAGKIIVGLIFLVFALYLAPVFLREFSENMKIIALPQSPLSFVTFFLFVGMVVATYVGIEAITRFSAIMVPIVSVAFFLIIASSSKYFDVSKITPILGNGIYEIFVAGLSKVSIFAGVILLFFLAPFIKSSKNFKTVGYASIITSAIFLVASVLSFSLVYQYPTGTENFLPVYQLSRLIEYGRFFQRIESVFVVTWGTAALLHLSTLLTLAVHVFRKTFGLVYYRPLIIPFAIIIFTLSFIPHNLMSTIEFEMFFFNYAWVLAFFIPLVLLLSARILKKRSKRKREDEKA